MSKAPKEGFFGYKPSPSNTEPQSKISFRETKRREAEKNKDIMAKNDNNNSQKLYKNEKIIFRSEEFFGRLSNFEQSIQELTSRNEEFSFKQTNSWGVNSFQCSNLKNYIISKREDIKNQIKYFEEIDIPNNLTSSALKINDLKNVFERLNKDLSCDKVLIAQEKDQEFLLNNQSDDKYSKKFSNLGVAEQYKFARNFLTVGDYVNAEKYFRKFVIRHPENALASKAQYWVGETFRVRQMWTDAASEYLTGYQRYPKSDIAPLNLVKLGVAMVEMGEKDMGCKLIAGVQLEYPNSKISVLQKAKYYAENQYNCDQRIVIAKNKSNSKKEEKIKNSNKSYCVNEGNLSSFGYPVTKFRSDSICKGRNFIVTKNTNKFLFDYLDERYQQVGGIFYIRPNDLAKLKSNKKIKIAKVEEPKQEEFKPKTKDIDNDAPIIEIAENITVDNQAYTLKGKVRDKSQIYLTIDGRQVQVKKGKFELERFNIDPDVAEEIKIVAIDKWNNRAEKTIKVTIDLQSTDTAKVYEDLNPNNVKVKTDKNKIAIIIGIEKYENLTNLDAKYANRDAKAFRAYATRALGIKPSNLKILIDDKATRSQVLKAFKLWLPKIAGDGGKDIHLFFAGHGLASDNGEDLYILPQDGESSLLEDTAISRVELISLINKVSPRSVTMFFDTCYSGQTRDERMLVASLRPIRIVADEQDTPTNFTIFTASNYDQTSGSIEEAKHGMFSYYLMKGLEGKADENEDKKITNGELIAYLKDNVSQEAFTQNRQQDPMLAGDPDKVLMSYR